MKNTYRFLLGICISLNFLVCNGFSGNKPPVPFVACKAASVKPIIDGKLDDECWKEGIEIGNFLLMEKGIPATEHTKVYICYDESNLYIAYKCYESCLDPVLNQLDMFKAQKSERDSSIWADDAVEIFLAPSEESSKYYHIAVNSKGVVYDSLGMSGPKSWDGEIRAAGQVGNTFWTLEVAIPFKDIGTGIPEIGKYWRINLCRTQKAKSENSSWAPVDNKGFHNPSSFGSVLFLKDFPSIENIEISDSKKGHGTLTADIQNLLEKSLDFKTVLSCSFDGEEPILRRENAQLEDKKSEKLKVEYSLNPENTCLNLCADKPETTSGARSVSIPVSAKTEYYFSALVKTENMNTRGKSLPFFYVDPYDKNGNRIQSSYDTVGVIDTSLKGWNEVTGTWKAPENASRIDFWIVKWKGAFTGNFEIDDLFFAEKGKKQNILPNGNFPKGNEAAGWATMGDSFKFGKSYGAGAEICSVAYSFSADGIWIYGSPVFKFKVENPEYPIKSSFRCFGSGTDKYFGYQINELCIPEGEAEIINLNLQSSKRKDIEKVYFEMEMPDYCRLIADFDKRNSRGPLEFKEEMVEKDGLPFRKYTMLFDPETVTDSDAYVFEYIPVPLVIKVSRAPENASSMIYYKAWLNEKEKEGKERTLSLKILPPLTGKMPKKLPLSFWGPSTEYFDYLSNAENHLMAEKFSRSGYNYKNVSIVDSKANSAFLASGMKTFLIIPTIHISGHFPGSLKYLRENPQYYEKNSDGKRVDVINLAHLLDKNCPFRRVMKDVLSEYVKAFPYYLNWDHEFSPVAKGAAGFSEENIKLFCKMKNISFSPEMTPQKILKEFKDKWVDFRCWQNAEIAGIYREIIKNANSDCVFSIYSAYQSPSTKEHYGVDWKYMGKNCDNIECGYGRSSFRETIEASGKKHIAGGELVWGGYYDLDTFENTIFQRLTDCGGYMSFCDWILDGRFYKASSRAASVASDFEIFFLNHNRKDELAVGTDGKLRADIVVLENNGERLIFIFNNSRELKEVTFKNLQLFSGAMAMDYETKTLFPDVELISTKIEPCRVKVIFVSGKNDRISGKSVAISKNNDGENIFRWKDEDGGRQKYTVQYSKDKEFKDAVIVNNIPTNFFVLPASTETWGKAYCRVKPTNVFTGKGGTWSEVSEIKIFKNSETDSTLQKYSYVMENPSIEKWGYICNHWLTPFSSWERDYKETRNGHKYSLKITNRYEESAGYLGNYDRRRPSGSRLMKVKAGEKCRLTAYVKASGKSVKTAISMMFINQEGKILKGPTAEAKISGNWEKVTASGKVPEGAIDLFFTFGIRGEGCAWFDDFDLEIFDKNFCR